MAVYRSDERPGRRAGSLRAASAPSSADVDAAVRAAQRPGNQGVALTPEAYSKVLRALMTGDESQRS